MRKHLRASSFALLAFLIISFGLSPSPSLGARSAKVLEGSVKENASLNPSLKVLPAPERAPGMPTFPRRDFFPLDADLVEFKGSVRFDGGKPTPHLNNDTPRRSSGTSGVIPPISKYTLVPRNTVLWVAPDFEVTTTEGQRTTSAVLPSQKKPPIMNKGVTSWADDASFNASTSTSTRVAAMPATAKGVTSWEPGYEVIRTASLQIQADRRGVGGLTEMDHTSIKSSIQQEVSTFITRSGVVCWTPGYEVSVETPGLIKTSLGGMWYAPGRPGPSAQILASGKNILEVLPVPIQPGMVAAPLLLPGLKSKAKDRAPDWASWYQNIATAIYSRWQNVQVGPGLATVRVSITRARDLSCRVVTFEPADGGERNAAAESAFKDQALTAVRDVRTFEIPEFPSFAQQDRVTFEVELKRTIDGPIGIDGSLLHHPQTTPVSNSRLSP